MSLGVRTAVIDRVVARSSMSRERFVDLGVLWQRFGSEDRLLFAGGVWDQTEMDWEVNADGRVPPRQCALFEVTPAQEKAADILLRWLRRNINGWEDQRPFYSIVLPAGRRVGKTTILGAFAALFAIVKPGSVVWFVTPSNTGWDEVKYQLERYMPDGSWAFMSETNVYLMVNGSQIMLKTPAGRQAAKEGAADLVLINEAQKIPGGASAANGGKSKGRKYYDAARASTIDRGGLVAIACNPPETADGLWLDELAEDVGKGKLADTRIVSMPQGRNPFADPVALQAWAESLDARAYAREYEGKLGLPTEDTVLYNWDPDHNVSAWRPHWRDITSQYLREVHRWQQDFKFVIGQDFNKRPHMASAIGKLVGGDARYPILWYFEQLIYTGSEDDHVALLAELVRENGAEPGECLVIADASGAWQNAQRKQESPPSWSALRNAGFVVRSPLPPKGEATHGENGSIHERFALARRLIRSVAGETRLAIAPECEHLISACRKFENKNGGPNKHSKWSHGVDAVTYPLVRLFRNDRVLH